MPSTRVLLLPALLALATSAASAQVAPPATERAAMPVFGLMVGTMSVNSDAAAASQVADRSYGLQLDAGALVRRHYYLGVDVGGQFLADRAQFAENTTAGRMKSTASVTYFSAIAGLRSGATSALPVELGLDVGGSVALSRRSIEQCVDCTVEHLHIPGGAFVEPVVVGGSRALRVRASGRIYAGGSGMRNVASLGVEWRPRRR